MEMTETAQALSLLTFYKGWGSYQRGLVKMLAPLTPAQLALPAGSHHWTIGMVAQHMVANRVWWFQVWMGEGDAELAPIAHWDPADETAQAPLDAAALVAGLEATWAMVEAALARWTPADLPEVFAPPAALREEERENFTPCTRQWIVWHVLEHEIHHGGELSVALGGYGLPGIYGAM
jgi:uncharacterized damage-inducible protein DinB